MLSASTVRVFVLLIHVLSHFILISSSNAKERSSPRLKRTTKQKFDVLLNLYKINPLRQSQVFNTFSNRILAPSMSVKAIDALHFDSNESTRENRARTLMNLKQIAEAIHVTQSHRSPAYNFKEVSEKLPSDGTFNVLETKSQNHEIFNKIPRRKVNDDIFKIDNLPLNFPSFEIKHGLKYNRKALRKFIDAEKSKSYPDIQYFDSEGVIVLR
ncbi:hypothetical protein ACJJTC_014173 [Scirpophaga incertulas]